MILNPKHIKNTRKSKWHRQYMGSTHGEEEIICLITNYFKQICF